MNKTIYYFTATGNSLQAALDIADGLGGAEVVSIAKAGMNTKCDSDVIGFVFPVFAWGMPSMVHDFISTGSFNKDAYFFAVVTCGMAIGSTARNVNALLQEKGAKLSCGTKLRMVANYIPAYDVNVMAQDKILEKAEKALATIIEDIKERKDSKIKRGSTLFSKLHLSMTASYKTADQNYNVSESCTGCGLCESVCPAKNIELTDGKPEFLHHCEHCLACIHWCPEKSINYGNKTQNRKRYHHPKVDPSQLP